MCGSLLLVELLDGHDLHLRLRQTAEHRRQLQVHLIEVFLIKVENFLAGMHVNLRISLERGVEALEIFIAKLIGDLQHAGFDFFDLSQTDLVNFFRREIRSGALLYAESVILGAIRQRPHARLAAPFRNIFVAHKGRECDVGREHRFSNRRQPRRRPNRRCDRFRGQYCS